MQYLRQSTASQSVLIGPFIDDTDGATAETGLTIANTDIRLSKNGGNMAAKNSGGGTHDELGYYTITLDATDSNTVGRLQLCVQVTGALPVYHEYQVLEEALYDALFAAGAAVIPANVTQFGGTAGSFAAGRPQVNTTHIAGSAVDTGTAQLGVNVVQAGATAWGSGAITAGAIAANAITSAKIAANAIGATQIAADAITAAKIAANAIGASELAADAVAEIADAVWDETQSTHVAAGSFGEMATEIAAILVDTAEIGAAGAGLTEAGGTGDQFTAIPWNAAWDAEVQSEVTDALNSYDPPTRTELTSDINGVNSNIAALNDLSAAEVNAEIDAALTAINLDHLMAAAVTGADVVDNSVIARLASASATADWDTFDNTTESLQALRDRGDAAWTTGAGGNPPQLLQSTTIATLASQTSFTLTAGSADDDAYNNAIIVVTDQATAVQKAVGSISDYTGATRTVTLAADPGIFTIAVGDTVEIIAALGATGSGPTANQIADAVWDELQGDHLGAGTFGEIATEMSTVLDATTTSGVVLSGTPDVNVAQISGDATAADNAESFFDGTGYNATANAMNITQIEGADATDQIANSVPSAAGIADAVWDEDATGHQTTGTFGQAIGDPGANAESIYDAVVTDATGVNVAADIVAIDGIVDQILVDTAEIGAAGAGLTEAGGNGDHLSAIPWNIAWDAEVQSEVTDALNAYDPPTRTELTSDINSVTSAISALNDISAAEVNAEVDTAIVDAALATAAALDTVDTNVDAILVDTGTTLPAQISALNDVSAAEVNAEIVDALATDTYSEPTGIPGATVSLADKISRLYMAMRNRIDVTASEKIVYDDSDNAEWKHNLSDDGTTYTESEATTP